MSTKLRAHACPHPTRRSRAGGRGAEAAPVSSCEGGLSPEGGHPRVLLPHSASRGQREALSSSNAVQAGAGR